MGKKRKLQPDAMIGGPAPVANGEITVQVPVKAVRPDVHIPIHVEIQLSREQGMALKRVYAALEGEGVRLRNDRRVRSCADAVRFVLEKIAEKL